MLKFYSIAYKTYNNGTYIDTYYAKTLKEESEVKKRVHNAISKLKPRQQQIIYMAYFENKTQEEIAKALGVSQQAISESLPRLLAKLKKILGKK